MKMISFNSMLFKQIPSTSSASVSQPSVLTNSRLNPPPVAPKPRVISCQVSSKFSFDSFLYAY